MGNSISDEHHFLYVFSQEDAEVGVVRLRKFVDNQYPDNSSEVVKPWARTPLKDATDIRRAVRGPTSLVSGAAVTPRFPVKPIFEGVVPLNGDYHLAIFGYDNPNGFIVDQPAPVDSHTRNHWLQGQNADRDELLPRFLQPGRQRAAMVVRTRNFEPLTWELDTQAGGGLATVDYSQEADAVVYDFNAIRGLFPARLRYEIIDPAVVLKVQFDRLQATRFNNAGIAATGLVVRYTDEENNDIAQDHWKQTDIGARIPGGLMSAHGKDATISRQLIPQLDRELARGELFNVPVEQISVSSVFEVPADVVQPGEDGFSGRVAVDHNDQYVWWGNDDWTDGDGIRVGRVHRMRVVSTAPLKLEYMHSVYAPVIAPDSGATVEDPLWRNRYQQGLEFGRGLAVAPDGRKLFVGGLRGPGVAVFNVFDDRVEYSHTLLTQIDSRPTPTNPWRVVDLNACLMDNGETVVFAGIQNLPYVAGVPAQIWSMVTDDDWQTSVDLLLESEDAPNRNGFDIRSDPMSGNVVCGMNELNGEQSLTILRTSDYWRTPGGVKRHKFNGLGRGYAAQPSKNGNIVAACVFSENRVALFRYDPLTDTYAEYDSLTPPVGLERLAESFSHKGLLFNAPSNRLVILDTLGAETPGNPDGLKHVYGRHGDKFEWLGAYSIDEIEGVDELATFFTNDTYLYRTRIAPLGGGGIIGVTVPEAP